MNIIAAALTLSLVLQVLPLSGRSTIRGRVLDADGQPLADVEMRAMTIDDRQLVGASARTDSEGHFSILKVPAGRILLRAQPLWRPPTKIAGQVKVFPNHPPVYFPGVLAIADAWPIEVGSEETIELDFQMPVVVVGSIRARVTGPDGFILEQLRVMRPEGNQIKNVKIDADGVGYAEELREGRHVIVARGRSGKKQLIAHETVHISAGEHPVHLVLAPAATISGRLVSERGGVPPIGNMRVAAVWNDGAIDLDPLSRDETEVAPDGSFTIDGLFGMRVLRVRGLDEGWQVAAIRHGRADVTTSGIELAPGTTTEVVITLTRR
jgi:hypothetical protein